MKRGLAVVMAAGLMSMALGSAAFAGPLDQGGAAAGALQVRESGVAVMGAAAETVQIDTLTLTIPEGFVKETEEDGSLLFTNEGKGVIFTVEAEAIPDMEGYEELLNTISDSILDEAMAESLGSADSIEVKQFPTGSWRCYYYADASSQGMPGSIRVYARLDGAKIQMVLFGGEIANVDTDGIMNNCLK